MAGNGKKRAILIAGPTASGKTALAIATARRMGASIVNTDSMQVYGMLDRLTARPDREELAQAPHLMFGHVDPAIRYSTGAWLADAAEIVAHCDGPLIFTGGTGLYFDALINGFADIPAVDSAHVLEAERAISGLDEPARMTLLEKADPRTARRLKVADPQRVVRALSVLSATGKPLSAFQSTNAPGPLAGHELEKIVLMPDRALLRQRIADRFAAMMDTGAVGEVEALLARDLDPSLPAVKAIGVSEIAAMLSGEISRAEAIAKSVTATRQYAKRQSTWFRNRFSDWRFIDPFA